MSSGKGSTADFVVVANRLPVDLERGKDGEIIAKRSPGGLVSALEPFLRSQQGAWVGWPGLTEDSKLDPFEEDGLLLHPVMLGAQDVEDYYEGFSNSTLWPLYHDVVMPPIFDRAWWDAYVRVNQKFAEATAAVVAEGGTVWIQDYQLQLVPKLLRELRPDVRIGFFLHIPFPPIELFMQLPWRTEIIQGLLGADLVGFHRPGGAQNFLWLARRLGGVEPMTTAVGVRTKQGLVQHGDRSVKVGAFPISIDSQQFDTLARSRDTELRAKEIREELGNPKRIMLGVDRLDYTKGIELRLQAIRELLAEGRIDPEDTVMVQLATPSRERVEHYKQMREDIEREVGRINGEFGKIGHPAVHYLHQSVSKQELVAFYTAADVMVVNPVRDGMNLVCKEYVACRHDLGGALVLSEMAGAAAELTSAFLVNPHDLEGVKDAIEAALIVNPAEGRRRMRALRRQVLTHDVDRWARSFLEALHAS
ncbi:trehalose-6-phosphate synthase [Pseudonocardiaceae bacterium YIM PH 21723]|nr:trehalose-6-phosphate synthase [Pseudonocardiaceae bacterium YIM PH 21723]